MTDCMLCFTLPTHHRPYGVVKSAGCCLSGVATRKNALANYSHERYKSNKPIMHAQSDYQLDSLEKLNRDQLCKLNWKALPCFTRELLDLHAEGALGNEQFAKLPRRPILCIDQIELLNEERIEASFRFPDNADDWSFNTDESLEMLFQDQLDQLVGFWGARKANGIGRALSSGVCNLHQSLDFVPGKRLRYSMQKRKWMENSAGGGTAVFNGKIIDDNDELLLETRNVIVGILNPDDIQKLRGKFGGTLGVDDSRVHEKVADLTIPLYDTDFGATDAQATIVDIREATQKITPDPWPFVYHFSADPVVPGNFGTHGMIALLKAVARDQFGLHHPVFKSMSKKSFSGMIFEDPKQIRFQLADISQTESNEVVAREGRLYLENLEGQKLIEEPIYTFKNLIVAEREAKA